MIFAAMRAFCRMKLTVIAALLLSAFAFGQTDQSTTAQQTAASQPTGQQPTSQQAASQQQTTPTPAKPRSTTPQSVAGAARASKQLQESAPPAKLYRNKDVKDPNDHGGPTSTGSSAAATPAGPAVAQAAAHTAAPTAVQTDAAQIQKDRAFEAQAKVFKSQILAEKGKIAGIQNRMTNLKYQFDAWSVSYSQDGDAPACWTSAYYTPYYKDWCDTGRNLKAQYDAAQRQLDQEKARLDQMQENIRRQGYGNAVYDPD